MILRFMLLALAALAITAIAPVLAPALGTAQACEATTYHGS